MSEEITEEPKINKGWQALHDAVDGLKKELLRSDLGRLVERSCIAVKKICDHFHKHYWKTTHTNPWQHATRQECRCGLSREMEFKSDADQMKGKPLWKRCQWKWSDGTISEYKGHHIWA